MGMGKRKNYIGLNTFGNKGLSLPKAHQRYYWSRFNFGNGEIQKIHLVQSGTFFFLNLIFLFLCPGLMVGKRTQADKTALDSN